MTDSANFQSQMSEIWRARREREMYRLDLEKEVFIKKQQREKRRDELRSKVKALHDDLVREDITSSQRVKLLLSKVESLKSEHQVLAAHTERLKLKKRQIELQLVTSYPIIHQAVQQEIRNSHPPMGISQVGHTSYLQNSHTLGPQQPWQNSGQPQQWQQSNQPYNVTQLGGVGETGYRGIPGIISTVNEPTDYYILRSSGNERLENHAEASQAASNNQFDKSRALEDQRNESIQKYLSTLENRIYSNPASHSSEHVLPKTIHNEVGQIYNSHAASNYHYPTHEQISNHQLNHRNHASQEEINSDIVDNQSYYSTQKGNFKYSPKQFTGQRLNSHPEKYGSIQQELRPNTKSEYAESISTAHNRNVTQKQLNDDSTTQSYDIENAQRSLEQTRIPDQYSIKREDEETIRSMQYTPNPPENAQHTSNSENQSYENNYDQQNYEHHEDIYSNSNQCNNDVIENFHSNQESQHYRENIKDSQNYDGHITDSQDYSENVAGSQNYRNNRSNSQNYINNTTDSQNYRENLTDSHSNRENVADSEYYREDAINSQNDRESVTDSQNYRLREPEAQNYREDETNSQNYRESITDSNYRENVSDSQSYKEDVADLQNYRENVKDSNFESNTHEDYSQAENVKEYSQESHVLRNQTIDSHMDMEYQPTADEHQEYEEYGNENRASCSNKYENHSHETVENSHLLSTINTSTTEESLIYKANQEKITHQDTEDSKNATSSFNKDNNIYDEEDSDFFERAGPVTSSAAYQNLLGVAAPSLGIESDSDEMEGQMAAMALKQKLPNTGPPTFKTFASTIPSLRPNAAILTDSDSVDSVEAAIQAAMNKKTEQGNNVVQSSETKAKLSESSTSNPVPVSTSHQNFPTQLNSTKAKPKPGNTALQLNLSDDESYNVSGGANDSYDEDDDDFFD